MALIMQLTIAIKQAENAYIFSLLFSIEKTFPEMISNDPNIISIKTTQNELIELILEFEITEPIL